MRIADAQWVPSSPRQTWHALTDPAVLRQCLPGCVRVEQISPTEYGVTLRAKVAGVETDYEGEILLSDLEPDRGATLAFEGKGHAAGLAIGTAQVALQPRDTGTRVSYTVSAMAGGKLAQVGEPALLKAGNKILDKFFSSLFEHMGRLGDEPPAESIRQPARAEHEGSRSPWSWFMAVGVIAVFVAYHWMA